MVSAKWAMWLVSIPLLGLVGWVSPVQADAFVTQAAVAGSWRPHAQAFARVRARQQVVLRLPFAARITALSVEPGTSVAAGEELARFAAPQLRRHLAVWQQARAEVAVARERLALLREGERTHAVTRRDRVQGEQALTIAKGKARLAWETLAADLDLLHEKIDAALLARRLDKEGVPVLARRLGRLRAPFAGVVTERRVAMGEQLAAGEAVMELESLASVYVDVEVTAAALPDWQAGETDWRRAGQPLTLRPLPGLPLYDDATGLWRLRFEAGNPGRVLRDGARIEVEHWGEARPVAWVPVSAVVARNEKTWCIVQEDGRFQPVEVQVGTATAERIPVLSGLKAGSRVVTQGAYELLYRDLKELIRFED